jgi:pyruvate,water dikinase
MPQLESETFEPPGPGLWAVDGQHHPRPATPIYFEVGLAANQRGQRAGTARYGSLQEGGRSALVNRFIYGQPALAASRPAGPDGAARARFRARIEADPALQERFAKAERALADEQWEADLDRWDQSSKPHLMGTTRRLAAVDPRTLSAEELAAHVDECLSHYALAGYFHHLMNPVATVPLGEFQLKGAEWTGLSPEALLGLLRGASPASAGREPEIVAVAAALERDGAASALLEGSDQSAGDRVQQLADRNGEIGAAMRALIATAGYRTTGGFDPMDVYALELQAAFLARIRQAMTGSRDEDDGAVAAARDRVPAARREEFDGLLERARRFARLKDERGLYANFPAGGLLRRAVLEVGRRAQAEGMIADREDMADVRPHELRAYLVDGVAPDGAALAERRAYRETYTISDVPRTLGAAHESPIPLDWLPPASAYLAELGGALFQVMRGTVRPTGEEIAASSSLRGTTASAGRYRGRVCLVVGPGDFGNVAEGDVIVTTATNPSYSMILGLAGAIVTEHGGAYSHAAIVAREFGIPCVVGVGGVTRWFRDGDEIVVNADEGVVSRR